MTGPNRERPVPASEGPCRVAVSPPRLPGVPAWANPPAGRQPGRPAPRGALSPKSTFLRRCDQRYRRFSDPGGFVVFGFWGFFHLKQQKNVQMQTDTENHGSPRPAAPAPLAFSAANSGPRRRLRDSGPNRENLGGGGGGLPLDGRRGRRRGGGCQLPAAAAPSEM